MFKKFILSLTLCCLSVVAQADNIWRNIDPIPLDLEFGGKPLILKVVTSKGDLPDAEWTAYREGTSAFYEQAWKDQDLNEFGIQGSLKDFINEHVDRNMAELETNREACFLCIGQQSADESFVPLAGIFSQKIYLTYGQDDSDGLKSYFFLRLLVMKNGAVMKEMGKIGQAILCKMPFNNVQRDCNGFLSAGRHKTVAMNKLFTGLGFTAIPSDELKEEKGTAAEILKHYDLNHYQFFAKDIKQERLSDSE